MTNTIFLRVLAILFSAALFFSCDDDTGELEKEKEMRLLRQYLESKSINTEPTASGLYFISTVPGSGSQPSSGNWVIIRYTAKMINDRVFDTTDESVAKSSNIHTSSVLYGNRRISMISMGIKGVQEGLELMKEGEQATLIIPSHLGYGNDGAGMVPAYSTLVYDIELVNVIEDPVEYEQEMIDNYIAQYADSTHLTIEEKESGLYYIEIQEGTGENTPQENETASILYTGRLTDGRVFDSNAGGSVYNLEIGAGGSIAGFEEAIKLMKPEGKSRVIIPSSSGYGTEGSGTKIVGYTPLVFDLELVEIK